MPGKKYVIVKCDVKDKSLKGVKFDGVVRAAHDAITNAINNKSSGKLTTKDKSPDGFIMTASVSTLKGDNNVKPTKLETKVMATVITIGSKAKAFTGNAG